MVSVFIVQELLSVIQNDKLSRCEPKNTLNQIQVLKQQSLFEGGQRKREVPWLIWRSLPLLNCHKTKADTCLFKTSTCLFEKAPTHLSKQPPVFI